MSWRVARSLEQLLAQINAGHPGRSKASDGSIGDTAHAATKSEHNPDSLGIVRARDFTHDPPRFDAGAFAEQLRINRDPRIKYIISNRRICAGNAGPSPWVWRPYNGLDPHTGHVHLSVVATAIADDPRLWVLGVLQTSPKIPIKAPTAIPSPAVIIPEEDMKDLIIACYHIVCGRPDTVQPSASEVNGWLISAAKGGWTPKQLVAAFADTTEAKKYAAR
jgi:hypothetical protein